jgi:(2S)-methylsuccinyl-CoA dehydrogenase
MNDFSQLVDQAESALEAAQSYVNEIGKVVRLAVYQDGQPNNALLTSRQRIVHGYAWAETTVHGLAAIISWSKGLLERGRMTEGEACVIKIAFGEYLAQFIGGIPMGQNEYFRPSDAGMTEAAQTLASESSVSEFLATGNSVKNRGMIFQYLLSSGYINDRFDDEFLDEIRSQYRRFTSEQIIPYAQAWHLANDLIPDELIDELAALGTFGVCIPEANGGLGLGKLVMCIITEELSRGWLAAGSLGTRSEIAGDLILASGTEAQKNTFLPQIANGEMLPTAVFTEPNTGSDLGSISTRAERVHDGWRINGAKTWITHASRSDLMTLLVRSLPDKKGYDGLSMLLAPKPRGNENDLFPVAGLTGTEVEVLGYRGMREYELAFDGFMAPKEALLGDEEGNGFKQLMSTFEGARIQTAARSVGVARRAFELGFQYACDRSQFGRQIADFPRVSDKLSMMITDIVVARELTYFAALEKDQGRRCDIEAGMAKLFAARAAWANADASVQIHGGNGYAQEFEISRILCDARILNIFEGAAEIQAQVIARGLLAGRN